MVFWEATSSEEVVSRWRKVTLEKVLRAEALLLFEMLLPVESAHQGQCMQSRVSGWALQLFGVLWLQGILLDVFTFSGVCCMREAGGRVGLAALRVLWLQASSRRCSPSQQCSAHAKGHWQRALQLFEEMRLPGSSR